MAGSVAFAANWPDFRGPRHDGSVPDAAASFPLKWTGTESLAWKAPLHGSGHSTPVIWGDQVWLTTATPDGRELSVMAFDLRDGSLLLDEVLFRVEAPSPLGNDVNTYASPSPVIKEGRVYLHFGSYGTACYDTATRKVLWRRNDLPCEHFRGPGSSPFLFDDLLILTMDGIDFQYLAALDCRTGQTVWKRDRSTEWNDLDESGKPVADGDYRKAYFTPILLRFADGEQQLVSGGAKAVWAYDPATGAELWQVRYEGFSGASRPVFGAGRVYVNSGYSRAVLYAIPLRGGERGELTGSGVAWETDNRIPNRSSPVFVEGRIYCVNDGGIVSCIDPETGETVWYERLAGQFSASPIVARGLIYFCSEQGKVFVIRPGDQLSLVAENELPEGGVFASPATDGERLLIRAATHLYCIRGEEEAAAAQSVPGAP
ncbi:MAG TPA: PQQ-binding-like beta-propeller repeat protein [Verrucomicrobiales bacterium]|nr:PQQ-binding-like beta-propeller repeat protein [Verrucomicrobiales bacterium]